MIAVAKTATRRRRRYPVAGKRKASAYRRGLFFIGAGIGVLLLVLAGPWWPNFTDTESAVVLMALMLVAAFVSAVCGCVFVLLEWRSTARPIAFALSASLLWAAAVGPSAWVVAYISHALDPTPADAAWNCYPATHGAAYCQIHGEPQVPPWRPALSGLP